MTLQAYMKGNTCIKIANKQQSMKRSTLVWVFHWINESVLVQGYFLNFFLLINRYSAIPVSICFLSHIYYQWWWRWTKRSNKTFSLYSTYYESSIPFFPERKGLFLYLSYERSLFFHSKKIVDFIFATAYCLSSCCCCCFPGWWRTRQIDLSVTGPINLWTCQSTDLSINTRW